MWVPRMRGAGKGIVEVTETRRAKGNTSLPVGWVELSSGNLRSMDRCVCGECVEEGETTAREVDWFDS